MVSRSGAAAGGLMKDFRDFIMQGNVVDLAVAVVIGGAFGKIVTSLIEDVLTPAILDPAMKAAQVDNIAELTLGSIKYGSFLAAVLNFLVIAFVIFLLVRSLEKAKKKMARQEAVAAMDSPDPAIVAQEQLTQALNDLNQTMRSQG